MVLHEINELEDMLLSSSKKSLTHFKKLNITDVDSDDLATFYKLPFLFAVSGDNESSKKVIEFIVKQFLRDDGDFVSVSGSKSSKPEYEHFQRYFNGWILRACSIVSINAPRIAKEYFESFDRDGFVKTTSIPEDNTSDVLTLAHQGMYYLTSNQLERAKIIATNLVEIFEKQELSEGVFYLKFSPSLELVREFEPSMAMMYSVSTRGEQLYFMLGFPCAFLASLYSIDRNDLYLKYAKKYMDYLLKCDNVIDSRFSHKTAWAASILYKETLDTKYLKVSRQIIETFLSMQDEESGLWFRDEGVDTSYDQSAEIASWFNLISDNICEAKMRISEILSDKDLAMPLRQRSKTI